MRIVKKVSQSKFLMDLDVVKHVMFDLQMSILTTTMFDDISISTEMKERKKTKNSRFLRIRKLFKITRMR